MTSGITPRLRRYRAVSRMPRCEPPRQGLALTRRPNRWFTIGWTTPARWSGSSFASMLALHRRGGFLLPGETGSRCGEDVRLMAGRIGADSWLVCSIAVKPGTALAAELSTSIADPENVEFTG